MASIQEYEIPTAGKWKGTMVLANGEEVVPEPSGSEAERKIWTAQLMIPFSVKKDHYAFGGPYPLHSEITSTEVNGLFPLYKTCEPRIFQSNPYNFGYLKNSFKLFRAAPYTAHKDYIPWLNRVEREYKDFWQSYGIYPLIQFSRTGPKYKPELLIAALHFYEKSTNTFQFRCGMLTPTLLDVAAITGLRPNGDHFDPTQTGHKVELNYKENTFSKYIAENMGKEGEEVSVEEHVAFLTLWLSHFVFCSKSLQVARMFIPLAQQINEGRLFSLGRLLLATLYEAMGNASDAIKASQDGSKFSVAGPIWLLQLWLNATFEQELGLIVPSDYQQEVDSREIEGQRLARLVPRSLDQDTRTLFLKHMKMFLNFNEFLPRHAPFVKREYGAAWFTEDFPAFDPDNEEDVNEVWRAYLEQTVLSCRIGGNANQYGLVGYLPNCVARQFGMSQIRPKSFFEKEDRMVLGTGISEKIYKKYLRMINTYELALKPFEFKSSFYCTDGFSMWWNEYYSRQSVGTAEHVLGMIESGFVVPALGQKIAASSRGKAVKKGDGSSKTSTEVRKPTGVKIKAEVEPSKPKSGKRKVNSETVSTSSKRSKDTIVVDVEADDDEEEEVPLVRKRKKPSSSTSQQDDAKNPAHLAKEAKKKKKVEEPKAPTIPATVQGDEEKKKKKKEEKEVGAILREKKVIKKTKVHRALKIHTPSDSEESPRPKENPAPEREAVVEKDQPVNEDKEVPGSKDDPLPITQPFVEDQCAAKEGKEDNFQSDGTTFTQHAPNAEEKDNTLNDPEVEGKKDESKDETPVENQESKSEETPSTGNVDKDQNSKGDGAEGDNGKKVDPGNPNEGPNAGGNAENDGHQDLPNSSSIKYSLPSSSTKSGQASSTQESLHESDEIPEAEKGGPELVSVSSTSKLSASLGVQEEEFTTMQKSDPAGTLRLLLSKKQTQPTSSSERTTTDSAPSDSEIDLVVRQDFLMLKLRNTFIHKDVLTQIEVNPACAFSHLAFLKKLHNPVTDEETLGKVMQLSSTIDQFAKVVQKKLDNDTRLGTQQQAQAMFYERAEKAQAEVERLSSQLKGGNPEIESCNENIAHYKQQIKILEEQVVSYRRKIIEEETKKARLEQEAKATTQEQIDAYGREGLQAFSSAEVIAEEIKAIEHSNLVADKELITLKKIYAECTKNL